MTVCQTGMIVAAGEARVAVRGRLSFLIAELLAHAEELQLDVSDQGRLTVNWGSGQMRLHVERFLPSVREPG